MRRGAFESVRKSESGVARPALESTIRPDNYGQGLNSLAKGFASIAEFFGGMTKMSEKAYSQEITNRSTLAKHARQLRELYDEYDSYGNDKQSSDARACAKNIQRMNQEISYDKDVLKRSNIFGIWGTPTDGE